MSERRIFIAVPAYDGKVCSSTLLCLDRAHEECISNGWQLGVFIQSSEALICKARDIMVAQFLSNADHTALLFVDADVAWKRGSFTRLMKHDEDFVAGAYPMRRDPEDYAIRALPDGAFNRRASDGLIEVAGCPTGFMRLRRSVLERCVEHRKDIWYEIKDLPGLRIHSLFHTPIIDHQMWSEDIAFCRMWREIGGKVFVDPDLVMYHVGQKMFSGCLSDFLNERFGSTTQSAPVAQQPVDAPSGNRVLDLARQAARR